MKAFFFRYFQPGSIVAILAVWYSIPASWLKVTWFPTVASIATVAMVQLLEFVNERHASWRINRRELLTDVFYVILFFYGVTTVEAILFDDPLAAAKESLGITNSWVGSLPFVAQVGLTLFVFEFGQYWMHRLMHNSLLWWTHAPHHHITQLNALKGFVGNPLELLLISIGVTALLDVPLNATFCAFNILAAVASFAHANVRFNPPRWYSYIFTTIETHSLHHRLGFIETRCNYANALILLDHVFGTYHEGESTVVGQDGRKRLTIAEQWLFPLRPFMAWRRARSASTPG